MAYGDYVVGDFFQVENLRYAGGLGFVVVEVCVDGFGRVAESQKVDDYEGVGEGEEGWYCACPHVCVVWVAVEEHEGWNVFVYLIVEVR